MANEKNLEVTFTFIKKLLKKDEIGLTLNTTEA